MTVKASSVVRICQSRLRLRSTDMKWVHELRVTMHILALSLRAHLAKVSLSVCRSPAAEYICAFGSYKLVW